MTTTGDLRERVAFEAPSKAKDDYGNKTDSWLPKYSCRAQFIYARGGESVEAARLSGRSFFKVRIRQCEAARSITQSFRMVDVRRGQEYNIREVDTITDRAWIYLLVESGVAV